MQRSIKFLLSFSAIVITTYYLLLSLSISKEFFAPLLTAIILCLLILPLARVLERRINRSFTSFLCSFFYFLISIIFLLLFIIQAATFFKNWDRIKSQVIPRVHNLENAISEHSPLDRKKIHEIISLETLNGESISSGQDSPKKNNKNDEGLFKKVFIFLGNYLLTFIYIYFILNYRSHFKKFIISLFPSNKRGKIRLILQEAIAVVPNYLKGKMILIGLLGVMYLIGLGFSGVPNFIIISIIAALLSIIPYFGNIFGYLLALSFGLLTGNMLYTFIGVTLTFSITQFVESYIFQPYIIGEKVDMHPFMVILAVIIGNFIWGVIGMILSIPLLGIISVICLHIKPLKPVGILISNRRE